MNVLIAGCGYVGTALGARLSGAGHRVYGLRRRPEALPGSITPVAADLRLPSSLSALPRDLDAVVYSAAATGFDDSSYEAVYDRGLAHLLAALEAAGSRPARLVFTSSVGVYAQRDGTAVDEGSPAAATGPQRHLLAGERRVAAFPARATSLRLSGLYGPGRTRLIDAVRAGLAPFHADPPLWTNRVHRDDAAAMIDFLLAHPDPPALLIGTDDEPATDEAVHRHLAARLGAPAPRRAEAPSTRGAGKRCSNARLRALGFEPRFPTFREGYDALIGGRDQGSPG